MKVLTLIILAASITGCATQKIAGPTPEFAPIIPAASDLQTIPTGSLYNVGHSDSWFGEKKSLPCR